MSDKDKKSVDDIMEVADAAGEILSGVTDLAEKHSDDIKRLTGSGGSVDVGDNSILNKADKTEDNVEIVVEADNEDMGSVEIEDMDGEVKLSIGGKSVTAKVPADAMVESSRAVYNNGILTVMIPRGGDGNGA